MNAEQYEALKETRFFESPIGLVYIGHSLLADILAPAERGQIQGSTDSEAADTWLAVCTTLDIPPSIAGMTVNEALMRCYYYIEATRQRFQNI